MPQYDFRSPRLFVDTPLAPGAKAELERAQAHYLVNVLRLGAGRPVLVFNGQDGEWLAKIAPEGRKSASLEVIEQTRPQPSAGNLHYHFAPLKHARLDYLVQKAVEMGVSRLQPVITRHTQAERINLERMRANSIEAAEQCGVLNLPEVLAPVQLPQLLETLEPDRLLIFCDEAAEVRDPITALRETGLRSPEAPVALLIGPEGGFSEEERVALLRLPCVVRLALGPRILRADTAAVAARARVQVVLGDWR
jgi:16S rRNA (uracil1498-N3)-methyltransferase